MLVRGGQGGRGNARFATPDAADASLCGGRQPPEERDVELRLKLLADAALAGLPNAGKSSLLRRLSNAKPKVADYPFTTLAPVLGTVESPDGVQLTVADVPGLIEGASEGVGLGHEFLAHLERARLLLHVIDASEDDIEERFRTIDRELALYGAGLEERPQAIVLNKIDLLGTPPVFGLDDPRIVGVFAVSAATGAGIEQLKRSLFTLVGPAPEPEEPELPEFRLGDGCAASQLIVLLTPWRSSRLSSPCSHASSTARVGPPNRPPAWPAPPRAHHARTDPPLRGSQAV